MDILTAWTASLPGAHHSISLTGGEPLLFADILADWLPELRGILPVHLETNGTLAAELERIIDQVDYISMDMKLPSTADCDEELWDLHRHFLKTARTKNVSVKIVVGDKTDAAEIQRVCTIIVRNSAGNAAFPSAVVPCRKTVAASAAVHLLHLQALASALPAGCTGYSADAQTNGGSVIIEEMTMPEFENGLNRTRTVLIPFGSVEEHGPHLPLSTDTIEAYEVAKKASLRIPLFVAPPVHYGNCRSTACHPGTISISTTTLKMLFKDIVRSLYSHGLRNFIALSGHAGGAHCMALQEAGEELFAEFADCEIAVVTEFLLAREERQGADRDSW